jgi:hypothetical protein
VSSTNPQTTAAPVDVEWYARGVAETERVLPTDIGTGLPATEAAEPLGRYGPNSLPKELPPRDSRSESTARPQWAAVLGLALLAPVVTEVGKAVHRHLAAPGNA